MYIIHLDSEDIMGETARSAVPTYEQETTISFGRDGNIVDVWTSDTTMMTKLDRLCNKSPQMYKCIEIGKYDGLLTNKRYTIMDKALVSFRSNRQKLNLTEEQIADRTKRLQSKK